MPSALPRSRELTRRLLDGDNDAVEELAVLCAAAGDGAVAEVTELAADLADARDVALCRGQWAAAAAADALERVARHTRRRLEARHDRQVRADEAAAAAERVLADVVAHPGSPAEVIAARIDASALQVGRALQHLRAAGAVSGDGGGGYRASSAHLPS